MDCELLFAMFLHGVLLAHVMMNVRPGMERYHVVQLRQLSFFNDEISPDPAQRDLQDKLAMYLDQVELHLSTQVSARSDALFAALLTIQDLYADVGESLKAIHRIRARIYLLHKHLVFSVGRLFA